MYVMFADAEDRIDDAAYLSHTGLARLAESGYGGKTNNVQVGDLAPVPLGGQA